MRSIGNVIKESRRKRKLSRKELEKETKIKADFIKSLEKEKWNTLPEYPVIVGFVKSLSSVLGIDPGKTVALLRRDYPPKSLSINPKPDVVQRFSWSPKNTFGLGMVLVVLTIFLYLSFQYINFITPPKLVVFKPSENQRVEEGLLTVSGNVEVEATVIVNNQPVVLSESGDFSTEIEVFEGTEEVVVVARSRSGRETVIIRKVDVALF